MQLINNYVKKYQQSTGQGAHKSSKDWGGLSKSDNKHRTNHLESLLDEDDVWDIPIGSNEMKSNLIDGKVPAGEVCFYSDECFIKKTACNGLGCPVTKESLGVSARTKPFSCAYVRLAELAHREEK